MKTPVSVFLFSKLQLVVATTVDLCYYSQHCLHGLQGMSHTAAECLPVLWHPVSASKQCVLSFLSPREISQLSATLMLSVLLFFIIGFYYFLLLGFTARGCNPRECMQKEWHLNISCPSSIKFILYNTILQLWDYAECTLRELRTNQSCSGHLSARVASEEIWSTQSLTRIRKCCKIFLSTKAFQYLATSWEVEMLKFSTEILLFLLNFSSSHLPT